MSVVRSVLGLIAIIVLFACPASAEWTWIQQNKSDKLIIFIHGLRGDAKSSFASDGGPSWPELMVMDKQPIRKEAAPSTYAIAMMGYPAGSGDRLNIQEISYRLLIEMDSSAVLDSYKEVIFIAHSLGGLIVKDLLITAAKDNYPISSKAAAVFLIAVPSKGAPAAEWAVKLFSEAVIEDLKPIDVNNYLQNLDADWDRLLRKRRGNRPRVFCAYERQRTLGVNVVPAVYTSTFCDEPALAENKDHFNIVKPRSTSDIMYIWVKGRLAALFATNQTTLPTAKPIEPETQPKKEVEKEAKPILPKRAERAPWQEACQRVLTSCQADPPKGTSPDCSQGSCETRYNSCVRTGSYCTNKKGWVTVR